MIEVFERHGAFADPDGIRQADARRLVTHVGAVGEIVGTELAHEHLIHERRFVRCAARGVKLRHVRVGQLAQLAADARERVLPRDGNEVVARRVVDYRMRQTPGVLEREVRPVPQLRSGMRGEEFEVRPLARRFPSHRLGAILAELERRGMTRIGPGAAGTIKALRLVYAAQSACLAVEGHLRTQSARHGLQCTPAAGRTAVGAYTRDLLVFSHRSPALDRNYRRKSNSST